jgi:dCMP deaminase|tara:strand:- start:8365 stop:8826 length:462 start_codon:yes stop_codon:yes gene_type:complete
MIVRPPWDQYFMGLAHYASIRSHDEQTKVGCVIVNNENHVLSMGYNGFPKGVDDSDLPTKRPEKYPFMVHAEENAVSNLVAITGDELKIYLTHYPCHRCAKLLWQNNVKKWFVEEKNLVASHTNDDRKVYNLLVDNGLKIVEICTHPSLIIGS